MFCFLAKTIRRLIIFAVSIINTSINLKKQSMELLNELKMTEVLQGEELDAALFAIRDKYTTEEDKRIMTEYMDARLNEVERQMDE